MPMTSMLAGVPNSLVRLVTSGQGTVTAPAYTGNAKVEAIGSGGGAPQSATAGGGGGGAYARSVLTVGSGVNLSYFCSGGGSNTWVATSNAQPVSSASGCSAAFGQIGSVGAGGAGGTVANSIGLLTFAGGAGNTNVGGGAAGDSGAGGNATASVPGASGAGVAFPGGSGGLGGAGGNSPGGGGGGNSTSAGSGGGGYVRITFTQ